MVDLDTDNRGKFRVYYIGGYGRSGSTVLEKSIARKCGYFSGGELHYLRLGNIKDKLCSCGSLIGECELWRGYSHEHIGSLKMWLSAKGIRAIIDSSKTTYSRFYRPLLWRLYGCEVHIFIPHRPIKDVIKSVQRGRSRFNRNFSITQYVFVLFHIVFARNVIPSGYRLLGFEVVKIGDVNNPDFNFSVLEDNHNHHMVGGNRNRFENS